MVGSLLSSYANLVHPADNMDGLVVATAAAAAGGLAYLNGRYAIAEDVRQLLRNRRFDKRLGDRIAQLQGWCTLYRMWQVADANSEALWFEDRSWTYGQLVAGESSHAWTVVTQGTIADKHL